jgi:hypothetical protein
MLVEAGQLVSHPAWIGRRARHLQAVQVEPSPGASSVAERLVQQQPRGDDEAHDRGDLAGLGRQDVWARRIKVQLDPELLAEGPDHTIVEDDVACHGLGDTHGRFLSDVSDGFLQVGDLWWQDHCRTRIGSLDRLQLCFDPIQERLPAGLHFLPAAGCARAVPQPTSQRHALHRLIRLGAILRTPEGDLGEVAGRIQRQAAAQRLRVRVTGKDWIIDIGDLGPLHLDREERPRAVPQGHVAPKRPPARSVPDVLLDVGEEDTRGQLLRPHLVGPLFGRGREPGSERTLVDDGTRHLRLRSSFVQRARRSSSGVPDPSPC